MHRTLSIFHALVFFGVVFPMHAGEKDQRAVHETEIDAGIQDVWKAFTTQEMLQRWMAPQVRIDLKVGGTMRSHYDPRGKIGDPGTIENTILSFDPPHMLSLKATKFPAGFPFARAAEKTWSVFYFKAITPNRTRVTIVGLGYTKEESSQRLRKFFSTANRQTMEKLKKVLKETEER